MLVRRDITHEIWFFDAILDHEWLMKFRRSRSDSKKQTDECCIYTCKNVA